MSLARRTQERILAQQQSASAPATMGSGLTPAAPAASTAAGRVGAQIKMRLTHDLRRLKEIKAISLKIAAKREMLPEYRAWCDGLLDAGRGAERGALPGNVADEVLPTIMVWHIDIGDWPRALELAEHVLRHDVKLPDRYARDAATLIVEEVAVAALKIQNADEIFPLDVLERVDELTADVDMHDEPRAKLIKAIGIELTREAMLLAAAESGTPAFVAAAERALVPLRRAQELHDRVGAKMTIAKLQKAIAAAAKGQAGSPPAA